MCNKRIKISSHKKIVVYLVTMPFSARDYARFGVDTWLNRGWNVHIFDFTKILRKKYWEYVDGEEASIGFPGISLLENSKDALNKIQRIKGRSIFIDLLDQGLFQWRVRKMAMRRGKILKLNLGSLPSPYVKSSLLQKIYRSITRPATLFQYAANKIFAVMSIESDYIVVGGAGSEKPTQSKIIRAHNLDYEFFLKDEDPHDISNSYILFLDEDLCFHPDDIYLGLPHCATPECYFPAMNRGLRAIAKIFAEDVVIAAHPRSSYQKRPGCFEFPTIKDRTYSLIKKARLVVAHGSTSIQMAVLLRKPILLVTTDELENSYCSGLYKSFRSALRKEAINLDGFLDSSAISAQSNIDDLIYDQYIQNYIKQPRTPVKELWEIVIDELEADFSGW